MITKDRTPYTGIYNRGNFFQGDSIPALSIKFVDSINECDPDTNTEYPYTQNLIPIKAELTYSEGCIQGEIREDGYIVFPGIDTSELEPGRYDYQIQVQLPNLQKRTYLQGNFKILRVVKYNESAESNENSTNEDNT